MSSEEKPRPRIDEMLVACGWVVQTKDRVNLSAARGVAICELSFATGEPDYLLFVDGRVIGTLEAKPSGETLTEVEEQSNKYVAGVPFGLPSWIPSGWRQVTLREIAMICGGLIKGQKRRPGEHLRRVPYLRVANVQRGYLDLSEVKEIEATDGEIEALLLQPSDILFNEGGDRDKLGRWWIWSGEISECIHQNHVFRARLRDPSHNPEFVSWYANTFGQNFFFDEGKHTTNPHLG